MIVESRKELRKEKKASIAEPPVGVVVFSPKGPTMVGYPQSETNCTRSRTWWQYGERETMCARVRTCEHIRAHTRTCENKRQRGGNEEARDDHSRNSGDLPRCNRRTAGPDGLTVQPLMYFDAVGMRRGDDVVVVVVVVK